MECSWMGALALFSTVDSSVGYLRDMTFIPRICHFSSEPN
jgi:hypothetical protein